MASDWERVDADPALAAALRQYYRGSGDPLDRLWWDAHPGERSPAGRPDPADAVESARRALFRREGRSVDPAEVERLTAAIAADRAETRRALLAADAEHRAAPATGRGPAAHGRRTIVGAVVAAALIAGAAGFAVGRTSFAPAPAALAVFSREQRADDSPPAGAALPASVSRSSTRFLGDSPTTGVDVFAAKASGGRVCLVAILLAGRFSATCSSPATFAVDGLSLSLQVTADPQDDSGAGTVQEVDPRWAPDGRFTF